MNNYIIIGDSIVYGIGDFENGGWATMFKKYVVKKDTTKICNKFVHIVGFPGATSKDVLSKLDSILDCYKEDDFKNIVVLSIGINDAQYFNSDFKESKNKYKKNINCIVEKIFERGFGLIILGLTKIVLDETNSECSFYTKDNNEEYETDLRIIMDNDNVLEQLCLEKKIKYISMKDSLTKDDYIDGLHPNTNGHRKIFEIMKKIIEE